jgi:hypothetical protein
VLFFPVGPHVDVTTARAALGAHDLVGKPGRFGIVGKLRDVDQALVAARIVEAGREQPLHAKVAHCAKRHRRAGSLFLLCHSGSRPTEIILQSQPNCRSCGLHEPLRRPQICQRLC